MLKKKKLCIFFILTCFLVLSGKTFADDELEQINEYDTRSVSTVNTTDGVKVFYQNNTNNDFLYVYEESTGVNRKIVSHSVLRVSAINTTDGVKVFYRNNTDNGFLYVYEESTGVSKKLTNHGVNNVSAIETEEGIKVFYSNSSDTSRLYVYEEKNESSRRLTTDTTFEIRAINTPAGWKVFYRNSNDNNFLYVYEESTGLRRNLLSRNIQDIRPIIRSDGTLEIIFRNRTQNDIIQKLNFETSQRQTLTNYFGTHSDLVEIEGELQLFYRNVSKNNHFYVYEESKGESRKISDQIVRDVSAISTSEGAKVFFSNESDNRHLYYYFNRYEIIENVSNITADIGHDKIYLTWNNPELEDLEKILIYNNGHFVEGNEVPNNEVTITNLQPGTDYEIRLTTKYGSGTESDGITLNLKTLEVQEVANINSQIGYDFIYLSWTNPSLEELEKVTIYKYGEVVKEVLTPNNEANITNLEPNTEYEIRLTTTYTTGYETQGITLNVKTREYVEEITNLFSQVGFNYIYLSWSNPELEDLKKVIIYNEEGQRIGETIVPEYEFLVEGLESNTEYEFLLTTSYGSGTESEGIRISLKTLEVKVEHLKVRNISAVPQHNRVNLKWENPNNEFFDYVRIYRKKHQNEQGETAFTDKLNNFIFGSIVYAEGDDFEPIFETNGTAFNDLTVEHSTTYDYKLNSVTTEGDEVEGVMVQTTTESEPEPTISGINQTTDENENYIYTWSSPTSGTINVFVGGELYDTVNASDQQIIISEDQMSYTALGNPNVQLQAITESGTEGPLQNGNPASLGGVNLPFNATDLLNSAVGLLSVIGSFILLVLAIRFAPRLISLIRNSFGKKQQTRRLK